MRSNDETIQYEIWCSKSADAGGWTSVHVRVCTQALQRTHSNPGAGRCKKYDWQLKFSQTSCATRHACGHMPAKRRMHSYKCLHCEKLCTLWQHAGLCTGFLRCNIDSTVLTDGLGCEVELFQCILGPGSRHPRAPFSFPECPRCVRKRHVRT